MPTSTTNRRPTAPTPASAGARSGTCAATATTSRGPGTTVPPARGRTCTTTPPPTTGSAAGAGTTTTTGDSPPPAPCVVRPGPAVHTIRPRKAKRGTPTRTPDLHAGNVLAAEREPWRLV